MSRQLYVGEASCEQLLKKQHWWLQSAIGVWCCQLPSCLILLWFTGTSSVVCSTHAAEIGWYRRKDMLWGTFKRRAVSWGHFFGQPQVRTCIRCLPKKKRMITFSAASPTHPPWFKSSQYYANEQGLLWCLVKSRSTFWWEQRGMETGWHRSWPLEGCRWLSAPEFPVFEVQVTSMTGFRRWIREPPPPGLGI